MKVDKSLALFDQFTDVGNAQRASRDEVPLMIEEGTVRGELCPIIWQRLCTIVDDVRLVAEVRIRMNMPVSRINDSIRTGRAVCSDCLTCRRAVRCSREAAVIYPQFCRGLILADAQRGSANASQGGPWWVDGTILPE